jgi:hypothetical protein
MTLQAAGFISLTDVANELGISAAIGLGDTAVSVLAGDAGFAVALSDLYGAQAFTMTWGSAGQTKGFTTYDPVGSISVPTFKSLVIKGLYDDLLANKFFLAITPNGLGAAFIHHVAVANTVMLSANATYSDNSGGASVWSWPLRNVQGLISPIRCTIK